VQFSVIIPTYNRPNALRACLLALDHSDCSKADFEVLVVDDGSQPPLQELFADFVCDLQLRWHRVSNRGPAAARNAGAALARSRFLAFIDDDCLATPGWLSTIAQALESSPEVIVGGTTRNLRDENVFALTWHVINDMVSDFQNVEPTRARFFASQNLALSAELFQAVGGFDETYARAGAEDREFCDRCRLLGHRLVLVPAAVLYHDPALDLAGFLRLYYRYGRGAYIYHRIRARRESGRIEQDLNMHVQLPALLSRRLSGIAWRKWPAVLSLIMLWELANAAGYLHERLARVWSDDVPGIVFRRSGSPAGSRGDGRPDKG
jgi:GT2 family glycosyltransferase